jgi:hypothetical protein
VTSELKELIAGMAVGGVEYMPISIRDRRKKLLSKDHFMVNPLWAVDCIDLGRSKVLYSKKNPTRVIEVRFAFCPRAGHPRAQGSHERGLDGAAVRLHPVTRGPVTRATGARGPGHPRATSLFTMESLDSPRAHRTGTRGAAGDRNAVNRVTDLSHQVRPELAPGYNHK